MIVVIPDLIPDANVWNPTTKGNFSKGRGGKNAIILVIHDTEGSRDSARAHFRNRASQVSAHYIVDKEGGIFQQVLDTDTAYHAGVSAWAGHTNINDISIGIELEYLASDNGPYPNPQYRAVVELSRQIVTRYNIPRSMVCKHAQCAIPLGRKTDPRNFPWEQFLSDVYSSSAPSPSPQPPATTPQPPATTPNPPPKAAGGEAFIVWLLDVIKRWLGG